MSLSASAQKIAFRSLAFLLILAQLAVNLPPAEAFHHQGLTETALSSSPAVLTVSPTWNDVGAGAAFTAQVARAAWAGELRWPAALEGDGDPATNPGPVTPVPVARVTRPDSGAALAYVLVTLGAEVAPGSPQHNPAGVMVTFHLVNPETGFDQVYTARSDAWGAASVEVMLDGNQPRGAYTYQASAPGYGLAARRSFTLDPTRTSGEYRLGDVTLEARQAPDGQLQVDIQSGLALAKDAVVELQAARLVPVSDQPAAPDVQLLPPVYAGPTGEFTARAEIYLEPGEYLLVASVNAGDDGATSLPALVKVLPFTPPALQRLEWQSEAGEDGLSWTQYRTAQGDLAFLRRPLQAVDALPEEPAAGTYGVFRQTMRLGAFQWRTDTYTITTHTLVDDGKKTISLNGFNYDPLVRTYSLSIRSHLKTPVDDRLVLQALGPNGVVIYEEARPVRLDPAQPLEVDFAVPAERGEPHGLRVVLQDPISLDYLWEGVGQLLSSAFEGFRSATNGMSVTLAATLKFELKLLEFSLLSASLTCTLSRGCELPVKVKTGFKEKDLIEAMWSAFTNWVYANFGRAASVTDVIQRLMNDGIEIAYATLSVGLGLRVSKTWSPDRCATKWQKEQLAKTIDQLGRQISDLCFKGKYLSESMFKKYRAKLTIMLPIPSAASPMLALRITNIFNLKPTGGKSGTYTLYVEGTLELGVKAAGVFIPNFLSQAATMLWDFVTLARFANAAFQTLQTLHLAVDIFRSAKTFDDYLKDCDEPPPNGGPDDRLDPLALYGPAEPGGTQAAINEAQAKIAAAEQLGLERARTYWLLQLRQAELAAFDADTSAYLEDLTVLEEDASQAETHINGLLDGSILPPPGQTVTEAVMATYEAFTTSYQQGQRYQERQALLDSLDFAQRQYNALAGQELELALELRRLEAGQGVGVLAGGLDRWTMAAMDTLGIGEVPVKILDRGWVEIAGREARYYSPHAAPPVLVIPTGGLADYVGNEQARQWLETYVSLGGVLVVLTQANGEDWGMLPGGQVRGLGYLEDILCRTRSVQVVNSSEWITGIDHDLPDIQVDGSLTAWPDNARLVLLRTTGTRLAAMLEYSYGLGTVVATTAYPDYYINGMQGLDDILFARSLFGQAYLKATGQHPFATVNRSAPINLPLTITNTNAQTATQVTFWRDHYDDRLGESWRWAAHSPGQYKASQVLNLDPTLPSGEARAVQFSFTAPGQAGLYRPAYFFNQTINYWWYRGGGIFAPFYQVRGAAFDLPAFSAYPDRPEYGYGDTALVTVTVRNTSAQARSFMLQPDASLAAAPVPLNLAAGQEQSLNFNVRMWDYLELRFVLSENEQPLSQVVLPLHMRPPSIGLQAAPDMLVSQSPETVAFTATVRDTGATQVQWKAFINGAPVYANTTPITPYADYGESVTNVAFPGLAAGTGVSVTASLPDGTATMTQTLEVVDPASLEGLEYTTPLTIGVLNPQALAVVVHDIGKPGKIRMQAQLRRGAVVQASGPVVEAAIGGQSALHALDVQLPSRQNLNFTYEIAVSATVQLDQYPSVSHSLSKAIALPMAAPQAALKDSTRKSGETLTLRIFSKQGQVMLPASGPYTVTLRDEYNLYRYTQVVPSGTSVDGELQISLVVPSIPYSVGYYMDVSSQRLVNWLESNPWSAPPQAFAYQAPSTAALGQVVSWTASNTGGVDSAITGTLRLLDGNARAVAQAPVARLVPVGASTVVTLAVPTQLLGGLYILQWGGRDHLGNLLYWEGRLTISGLTVSLDGRTENPIYLAGDLVTATNHVTASAVISGAQLRLRVLRALPGWTGWGDPSGDGGASFFIPENAVPPLTQDWSLLDSTGPALSQGSQFFHEVTGSTFPDVVMRRSSDGGEIWRVSSTFLSDQAYNSQYMYTLDGSGLVARYPSDGQLAWSRTADPYNDLTDLLVSNEALAVFSKASGYLLLDPASGGQRGVITPTVKGALLAGSSLYTVYGSTMTATNATTGAALWSVPYTGTLQAANSSYVLSVRNVGASMGTTTLYVFSAATGALLRQVVLTNPIIAPISMALKGSSLYYKVYANFGSNMTKIYKLDLASGEQSLFTQLTGDESFRRIIITGDWLHALVTNPYRVRSYPLAGGTAFTVTLAAPCDASATDLAMTDQGLLVSISGGWKWCLLRASQPLGGSGLGPMVAIKEDWQTVNGSGVLAYNKLLAGLESDSRARGPLYLESTLYSRDPQGEPQPTNRHILAYTTPYPFTIVEGNYTVTLAASWPYYRKNVTGYTPDNNASTVGLSGRVRNPNPATANLTVTVSRGTTTLLNQTFNSVPPGGTRDFATSDATPPEGLVDYRATVNLGTTVTATVQVSKVTPSATSSASPAILARGEGTTLAVVMNNADSLPSFVTANLGGGAQNVTLAAGQTVTLTRLVTPTAIGMVGLPITFTGDITRTDWITIQVRDETLTGALSLAGVTRDAATLVRSPAAALALRLANNGEYMYDARVDYAVFSAPLLAGSDLIEVPLAPVTYTYDLSGLPAGAHTALVTVTHARLGTALAQLSLPFTLVEPRWNLDLQADAIEAGTDGGPRLRLEAANLPTSDLPWSGSLALSGAVQQTTPLTLPLGATAVFTVPVELPQRAGPVVIYTALLNPDGTEAVSRTVTFNAAQRMVTELDLTGAQGGTGVVGGLATLTAYVRNGGPAGDARLQVDAFDQYFERLAPVAGGLNTITLSIPVPGGLLAGTYPAVVRLGEQQQPAEITVTGPALSLSHALDAASYLPDSPATWTLRLACLQGDAQDYDVILRYGDAAYTYTANLAAGQAVYIPWTFTTAFATQPATVLVTNHPLDESQARFTVLIDSLNVPVRAQAGVWLEIDKRAYLPGETVHLTFHLDSPVQRAAIFAPEGLAGNPEGLVWSSLDYSETLIISGTYQASFQLPAAARRGRYEFRYTFDDNQDVLPFDLLGTSFAIESLAVSGPDGTAAVHPNDLLTITAQVRLDAPLSGVVLQAYALQPDHTYIDLGAGALVQRDLPAGVTPLTFTGPLATAQAGPHPLLLVAWLAASGQGLGGRATYVQVGQAQVEDLATDHGVYTPGQPGAATLDLYGLSPAQVRVTTSGGQTVFNQAVDLDGFQTFTFNIPTAIVGDEVLTAVLTDSLGLVSTRQASYRVASSFDTTPPELAVLTPPDGSAVFFTSAAHRVTVTGLVTETGTLDYIALTWGYSSTLATVAPNGKDWSAQLTLDSGPNLIQIIAVDKAGNMAAPPVYTLWGQPSAGVTFSAEPAQANLGDTVVFRAVVTATETMSATLLFPFSVEHFIGVNGSATSGVLSLGSDGASWWGYVSPGQPVTIQWTGQASAPGEFDANALLRGDSGAWLSSPSVAMEVTASRKLFLPLVNKQVGN